MTEQRGDFLHLVPEPSSVSTDMHVAMLEDELAGLREAMKTRGVIEQAKGMLMMTYSIPSDQAFRVLVRWSSRHNIKLVTVARTLVSICSRAAEPAVIPQRNLEQVMRAALTR